MSDRSARGGGLQLELRPTELYIAVIKSTAASLWWSLRRYYEGLIREEPEVHPTLPGRGLPDNFAPCQAAKALHAPITSRLCWQLLIPLAGESFRLLSRSLLRLLVPLRELHDTLGVQLLHCWQVGLKASQKVRVVVSNSSQPRLVCQIWE
jgi:hypothetical protein